MRPSLHCHRGSLVKRKYCTNMKHIAEVAEVVKDKHTDNIVMPADWGGSFHTAEAGEARACQGAARTPGGKYQVLSKGRKW